MYRIVIGAAIVATFLTGCENHQAQKLNGTGSTFAQPIMNRWAEEYQKSHHGQVNYEAIGSSVGIQRLESGLFNFACTDAPLNDAQLAELKKHGGDILYIPLVLG